MKSRIGLPATVNVVEFFTVELTPIGGELAVSFEENMLIGIVECVVDRPVEVRSGGPALEIGGGIDHPVARCVVETVIVGE